MSSFEQSAIRREGYLMIGAPAPIGDTEISIQEANDLRAFVANDFFDNVPARTPELTEISDKTIYGKGYHETYGDIIATPNIFFGAMLKHFENDSWRMVCLRTKSFRSEWNNSAHRIASRYRFEAFDGHLVEAIKSVSIIRGIGELSIASVENEDELETQRKMYERLVQPDDCTKLIEAMDRAIKRQRIA